MQQHNTKLPQFSTVLHLTQIYSIIGNPEDNKYATIFENLQKRFAQVYGEDPSYFVRVPGSVNLFQSMGSACSFNVERDIIIAFRKHPSQIKVGSTSNLFYPQFSLSLDPLAKIQENETNPKLNNLIKAVTLGYKAALVGVTNVTSGFNCVISVTELPQKSGFGFHSAVSIAFAMVTLFCNQIPVSKPQLISQLDQLKNSLYQIPLGKEIVGVYNLSNHVMLRDGSIDVMKGRTDDIFVPFLEGYHFVIADSLASTPKLITYQKRMTKRRFELSMANRVLRKRLNLSDNDEDILDLQQLLDYSDEDMITLAKEHLTQPFTVKQLEQELQHSISELIGQVPYFEQLQLTNMTFDLFRQHTFIPSILVRSYFTTEKVFDVFNFDEQMALYEGDNKELLELRDELKMHKAIGVKVIGQNWGGVLMALFPSSACSSVVNHLQDSYCQDPKKSQLISEDLSLHVFESQLSGGAVFLDPQYEIWY